MACFRTAILIRYRYPALGALPTHNMQKNYKSIRRFLLAASLFGCLPLPAGTPTDPGIAETTVAGSSATGLLLGKFPGETAFDRIWSAATLYKDDNNPVLQEFSLQGRLQVQYADGHCDDGHFDIQDYKNNGHNESVWGDHIEARRAYLGIKTRWFQHWKLEGQIDVDTDGLDGTGPGHTLYKDIYDLYLTYAPSDAFNISIGKQEIKLPREQEISSKEILTFERSQSANMILPGNLTGIWVNGKGIGKHWLYELGIYSNDQVRQFSNFDGGTLVLGKIGYDYSAQSGLDSAIVSFRYLHNSQPGFKSEASVPNYTTPTSPSFSDTICLSNDIVQGRFGLTTDLIYGFGYHGNAEQAGVSKRIDQPDIFGFNIIPSYFIAAGLQLVGRLQIATSAGANGLSLPNRYEGSSPSTDKKGNTYTSLYAGLNYYIYGHKLKLMNGIEYSRLGGGDYDGYTYLSGLRFSF